VGRPAQLVPEEGDYAHVRWWALVTYVPHWLGITWYRSVRGRFSLRRIVEVPQRRLLPCRVSCVGFAAILALPFRLGELARPYIRRRRSLRCSLLPGHVRQLGAVTAILLPIILK
jgi:hypothetical protein